MFNLFCRHWGGCDSAEFRKGFNPENVSIVVMNGRRVGYLSVKLDDQGVYIENIQLSRFLQGRGTGTEILVQLLNRYGNEIIRLTTFSDNPARRLYERLGFIITEREEGTLRMARLPDKTNAADAKNRAAD
nr:GNAT family N-acetyltransferase [Sedimenticola hydrogenitrophicus]